MMACPTVSRVEAASRELRAARVAHAIADYDGALATCDATDQQTKQRLSAGEISPILAQHLRTTTEARRQALKEARAHHVAKLERGA